ncbi:MAG: PrsW family intramembrane metalloprotease [Anaerolineaceae bacterium]|nr:PrsW family intramembrane metalloprotease [Anaerolineaceae bacterium]
MQDVVEQHPKRVLFLPPVLQVFLSGFGLLFFISIGCVMLMVGFVSLFEGSLTSIEITPFFSMAWIAFFFGILLFPSLLYAARSLSGKDEFPWRLKNPRRLSILGMILWLPVVLLGELILRESSFSWLLLPPIQILSVALPLFFLFELGRSKLTTDGSQRSWGPLSFGLMITQPLVMVVEIILLGMVGVFILLWVSTQPELMDEFTRLGQRLMNTQLDPAFLERIMVSYLQNPKVIYAMLTVAAGLVPIVEELLKPLAIWVFIGRRFSPVEGFVMGLVAGGTFALVESLGMVGSSVDVSLVGVVLVRLGTGILHSTTTALVGWGLGAAWEAGKYLKLGIIFFLAVSLHGIWNVFGLLVGLSPYLPEGSLALRLGTIAPLALSVLAMTLLLIMVGSNRRLQRQVSTDAQQK